MVGSLIEECEAVVEPFFSDRMLINLPDAIGDQSFTLHLVVFELIRHIFNFHNSGIVHLR